MTRSVQQSENTNNTDVVVLDDLGSVVSPLVFIFRAAKIYEDYQGLVQRVPPYCGLQYAY